MPDEGRHYVAVGREFAGTTIEFGLMWTIWKKLGAQFVEPVESD
jgi:hypothetical protein